MLRLSFPEQFWQLFPNDTSLLEGIQVTFIQQIDFFNKYDNNFFIASKEQVALLDPSTLARAPILNRFAPYRLHKFKRLTATVGMGTPSKDVRTNAHQIAVLRNGIWQVMDTKLRFKHGYFFDEATTLI